MPALVCDGILSVLILEDWQVDIWPLGSLLGCQAWHVCLEPPDLSDIDATDEEVDAELVTFESMI